MTRPKAARTTTQINFRMPDDLLTRIDSLADKNFHDRSSEINNACRYWIVSGAGDTWAAQTAEPYGNSKSESDAVNRFAKEETDRPLNGKAIASGKIEDLQTAIETLTEKLAAERAEHAKILTALQNEVASLTASFETERKLLLKIIEGHETTIRNILQFAGKKEEK